MEKVESETSSREGFTAQPGVNDNGASSDEEEWYLYLTEGVVGFEADLSPHFTERMINELVQVDRQQEILFQRETVRKTVSREDVCELIASVAVSSIPLKLKSVISYAEREDDFIVAAECGDDNIKFTNQPAITLVSSLYCQRIFGMKVSISDSFLSQRVGNYTEKWTMMPRDRLDLASKLLVRGTDRTTPIIDIPALRAGLPTTDQTREISSSIVGKAALYARCLNYSRNTVDEVTCWKASIIQDVALSVFTQGKCFPYLPQSLGGLGKPFPMNSKENIVRAARAYKRGRYERLIYTIISHAKELVDPQSRVFSKDPFIETVKNMYQGYDPEFRYFRKNMPLAKGLVPPWAFEHMIGEFSTSAASNAALRRLRTSGLIVAERDLIMASEVENHVYSMLSSDPTSFVEMKTAAYRSFGAEVIKGRSFSSLYNQLVDVHVFSYGLNDEEKSFAIWMDFDDTYKVANFMFGERFFLREALDVIFFRGPSKVSFPLIVQGKRFGGRGEMGIKPAPEEPPPDELIKDYEDLVSWALNPNGLLPPRNLLEDDDIILEEVRNAILASENPIFIAVIVTEDRALCARINESTEAVVVMLPTTVLYHALRGVFPQLRGLERAEGVRYLTERFLSRLPSSITVNTYDSGDVWVDTGSWAAVSERESTFPYRQPSSFRDDTLVYQAYRIEVAEPDRLLRAVEGWPENHHMFDRGHLLDMSGRVKNPSIGIDRAWRDSSNRGGLFHTFVSGVRSKAKLLSQRSRQVFLRSKDRERPAPELPTEEEMRNLFFGEEDSGEEM